MGRQRTGGIYHYVGGNWSTIAGGADDISVGPDGSVYVTSNVAGDPLGNGIWHCVNGGGPSWRVPRSGSRLQGTRARTPPARPAVLFYPAGFTLPTSRAKFSTIVQRPFTEESRAAIGRITPTGTVTEFLNSLYPLAGPLCITAGPDGNMWFTEENASAIGRITPAGTVTQFSVSEDPSRPES